MIPNPESTFPMLQDDPRHKPTPVHRPAAKAQEKECDQMFTGMDPHSLLPPLTGWNGASESLIAGAEHPWITPAEESGLTQTPGYDDSMAWLGKLCESSPLLSMRVCGHSAQGRPILMVIASSAINHDVDSLRATGKPTLLVQAGIHPGEIEGKDAGFMLLRDIACGSKATLLDGANLIFLPVLNPDGHERSSKWNRPNQRGPANMGWRTTAQNLNLNRDYVKAAAPEMRALLSVLNAWPVDLYLDVHATDGLDYQYDITYAYHGRLGSPSWSPSINKWIDQSYSPAIDEALRLAGHLPLNFYVTPLKKTEIVQGLREWQMSPRLSLGFGDIRHIPTVLIETHSLKPHRQRVLATYVTIEASLRHLAEERNTLAAAITEDRTRRTAEVPLTWSGGGPRRKMDFLGVAHELYQSPASGAVEIRWLGRPQTYPNLPVFSDRIGLTAKRPVAYWVPETKPQVIELLRAQGIVFETLEETRTLELETHRITLSTKPHTVKTEESRLTVNVAGTEHETQPMTFRPGAIRVPTDQPLGDLAIMMLEPKGADSLLHWGFFSEILQRTEYIEGYIIAPLAERMLEEIPGLKIEFETALEEDPALENDPVARLQWFYRRTPFYDQQYLRYPVGIERSPIL